MGSIPPVRASKHVDGAQGSQTASKDGEGSQKPEQETTGHWRSHRSAHQPQALSTLEQTLHQQSCQHHNIISQAAQQFVKT